MWCSIINGTLLVFWIIMLILAPDMVYRTQYKWFPIPRETFNIVMYSFLGLFKIVFLIFNIVPWVALIIVGWKMINLTKKAANRFKIQWHNLQQREGDFWKLDVFMMGRIPMLLIVHEYTLFTLVRRKSEFKAIGAVAEEILRCCAWYRYDEEISTGKNSDRRISGSINEMKRILEFLHTAEQINKMEMTINKTLFSYLSGKKDDYNTPFNAVELYQQGKLPGY
jgi:hypothetical protein